MFVVRPFELLLIWNAMVFLDVNVCFGKELYALHLQHPCHFVNKGMHMTTLHHCAVRGHLQKVIIFSISLCIDFGNEFGANLASKTLPKWSQIGSKIDASWGVDLTLVLEGLLAPCLLIFDLNMPRLEYLKSIKNVELSPNLLVFRYCGCCAVELTL